ncbi:hypothetical protein PUN28_016222 [Cardiocondyla obscurior]|uniref:Histone H2B n=1 Tax=Cardiocondyla obscurior TaxID=286306 RepID=A0AAW2ERH3_9HYME
MFKCKTCAIRAARSDLHDFFFGRERSVKRKTDGKREIGKKERTRGKDTGKFLYPIDSDLIRSLRAIGDRIVSEHGGAVSSHALDSLLMSIVSGGVLDASRSLAEKRADGETARGQGDARKGSGERERERERKGWRAEH